MCVYIRQFYNSIPIPFLRLRVKVETYTIFTAEKWWVL
jgi:hypothetical protein